MIKVLIETYWNVKKSPAAELVSEPSINRNILECKGWYDAGYADHGVCINRNILECKDSYFSTYKSDPASINRNILECKEVIE